MRVPEAAGAAVGPGNTALQPAVLPSTRTGTGLAEASRQQGLSGDGAVQQLIACMALSSAEVAEGDGVAIGCIVTTMAATPPSQRYHLSLILKQAFQQASSTLWRPHCCFMEHPESRPVPVLQCESAWRVMVAGSQSIRGGRRNPCCRRG